MKGDRIRSPLAVSLGAAVMALVLWNGSGIDRAGADHRKADGPAGTQQSEEFRWSGNMRAGMTLEIKGISGGVMAEGVSGGQAEVLAVKQGKDDDPADVRIEVVEHDGGVTICALYPAKSGKEPNECAPGKEGHLGGGDSDVSVQFTVKVPRGVDFAAQTVNGGIEAKAIDGDVQATTVNGGVTIAAAGSASARTVNGSVTAALGRAEGPLSFQTVNGSITVEIPDGTGAEVKAQTVRGKIDTDFPITVKGQYGMSSAKGSIGGGGASLSLQTVNGSIELRKVSG